MSHRTSSALRHAASRRRFLRNSTLATLAAALGGPIPFARNLAPGLFPDVLAQSVADLLPDKRGLRILGDRPIVAETPVTLLDDDITPTERHFVRNNGHPPERAAKRDLTGWSLTIDGEVEKPLKLTLAELQSQFPKITRALVIECAGNGRAAFNPPASGNQWTLGGVGCATYTGVRLGDVLRRAGVKQSAIYIGYESEDAHLSRAPGKHAISRGVPIAKALDEHTLLAWEMNGQPLPAVHGWPLRLVCPGWPASTSGKWLKRIWVRDREHDGEKMKGHSYRLPKFPVAPGTKVPPEDMAIIHELPVKSIITLPASGAEVPAAQPALLRGHAWSGWGDVKAMHLSYDFGATWVAAKLSPPRNRFAWQRWELAVKLPTKGYYEVWARATDEKGFQQPMLVPGWNPEGYANNAMHRIALKAV
ncbi:MAG: Sulfite oxidase [Limisphaerales bacterium]|nr:MAG: Sulfite oxidase [Limisphaerales bacterium]TXT46434.1 MAG: Sulfite oxidase [Limisphaerales bacterium]